VLDPVSTIDGVRAAVARAQAAGSRVGLVPTMGALHAGHAALIERCRGESEYVVVSIFVNPTQFGPAEDLMRYPRTLKDDLLLCQTSGAHMVFAPDEQTMYPGGRDGTFVEVPGLSRVLEGASRPGHFRGVATVVLALLEIVRPDLVVFGQKDYQQQLLIRRMIADLHIGVEVITEPTVREADGLAMSSRNRYLSTDERRAARVLYDALSRAKEAVDGGERDANRVRQTLTSTIELEALAKLDYVEVADAGTLDPLVEIEFGRPAVALVAARVGSTRLIDNALLTERPCG
jgi:pantoate--beta-alanine ligase